MRRALLLVIMVGGLALAQSYERKASETDKPAVFGYMISEFFHQRYQQGPAPIWRATAPVLGLDALLLLGLFHRTRRGRR